MALPEKNKKPDRLLIYLLLIFFLINFVTGIIKFPEFQRYFLFVYGYISAARFSWIHDYSGLILVGLIILHLWTKRKRLIEHLAVSFRISGTASKILTILAVTFIGVGAILIFASNFFGNKPIKLSGVEVRDYQGEKLGSINDFRENSIKGVQYIDINNYKLEISGLISAPALYDYDDVLRLTAYQKVVTLNCVEGWSVKALWEGVLVRDLLKNTGIKPEAKTVIFYAADGYSTSFPLDYILNNDIIIAYKLNGVTLPAERGFPFQLVAEQKWGYKWIKWITKIELSSDTNYKGFWESRGYNNNGDLSGSKYE